jgi:hypothetical protein
MTTIDYVPIEACAGNNPDAWMRELIAVDPDLLCCSPLFISGVPVPDPDPFEAVIFAGEARTRDEAAQSLAGACPANCQSSGSLAPSVIVAVPARRAEKPHARAGGGTLRAGHSSQSTGGNRARTRVALGAARVSTAVRRTRRGRKPRARRGRCWVL